ncbi:MAG: acyl-ACP--UDP-N-acetylglucosamine O-acyltransferase [Phycisphaerales bacterium]|nr:MAG: acyl-ACP--UDP-N-acetylglucosamine O-acyltransferase [Phycisphaerales bacterium]
MTDIHPHACVESGAELGRNVRVGPFCVVGPHVQLGDGCVLHNNVTVTGRTRIGPNNEFFPGAVVGTSPQDLKYKGTETELHVGSGNIFREFVTVHTGTEVASRITRIGSNNRFLAGVHLAHDCMVGDQCVIANYVQLAGHVHVEDYCHIGGLAAFHHFVTIGRYSYVGGMARVTVDVPPYMIMQGYPARVRGVNVNGMNRWGLNSDSVAALKDAYRRLFARKGEDDFANLTGRIERLEAAGDLDEHARYLCEFLRRSTHEGVYGRYRESLRADTAADRAGYYGESSKGGSGPSKGKTKT